MAAQPRAEFQKGFKPPFQKQSNAPGSQFALNPPPLDDITADGQPYKAAGYANHISYHNKGLTYTNVASCKAVPL
jgi:hypothetical protein